jgi:FKBP-type peptidyl-prolyl cis-trans isomerase SlyD
MIIEKNKVVYMHYTLKDSDGETIDSSAGGEPLPFIQGLGNIIPGLEKELEGKKVGDKVTAVIPAEQGYGEVSDTLVQLIPLASFPDKDQVVMNATFQLQTPEGPVTATVKSIDGDDVKLDFNHPLAGVELHFDVEVTEVREPTEEETAHGHVHVHHSCSSC